MHYGLQICKYVQIRTDTYEYKHNTYEYEYVRIRTNTYEYVQKYTDTHHSSVDVTRFEGSAVDKLRAIEIRMSKKKLGVQVGHAVSQIAQGK